LKFYIQNSDCLEAMKRLPDNSVDSIITDPPYGLSFMGKDWDHGIPGVVYWKEMLRIAKPGAILMAFGGTRTFHRLTTAIEDAGWEIRDCMMWLYGTGFPKSHNISKALDKKAGAKRKVIGSKVGLPGYSLAEHKGRGVMNAAITNTLNEPLKECEITEPATTEAKQWDGIGTALKPAWEPIILAMKPLDGTFAENALKWGVAGLNIDECRVAGGSDKRMCGTTDKSGVNSIVLGARKETRTTQGRFPANVILDEESGKILDEQSGISKSTGGKTKKFSQNKEIYGEYGEKIRANAGGLGDTGGASRFFYCAKASKSERGKENNHPTVKPLKLMQYLCKLVKMPKQGLILDPFCGSGSTGIAAVKEGFRFLGIDKEKEYTEIAKKRLKEEK